MKKLLTIAMLSVVGTTVLGQEAYQGVYTYGDYNPIYLAEDDGTVDSSFSYCSYGQLELNWQNDSLHFNIEVCNATYHVGAVSGALTFTSDTTAVFKDEMDDDLMKCHLEFSFRGEEIHVEEVDCGAWHGARASFYGDFGYVRSTGLQMKSDEVVIEKVIEDFFNCFKTKDSVKLAQLFTGLGEVRLTTIMWDETGEHIMIPTPASAFVKNIGSIKPRIEEKVSNIHVMVEDGFATATMDYKLYVNEEMSHCGINEFQFIKSVDGWKIIDIKDTHRATACEDNEGFSGDYPSFMEHTLSEQVNDVMDTWHKAAAEADEDVYFPLMHEDCIYLGTDKTERWDKYDFERFAKPHFEKESAWAFTANWRNVYFSHDYETAWFEESLDTWMGECRGSGVLVKSGDSWLILHYNLAVTIDNDKIKKFIELVNE